MNEINRVLEGNYDVKVTDKREKEKIQKILEEIYKKIKAGLLDAKDITQKKEMYNELLAIEEIKNTRLHNVIEKCITQPMEKEHCFVKCLLKLNVSLYE